MAKRGEISGFSFAVWVMCASVVLSMGAAVLTVTLAKYDMLPHRAVTLGRDVR